MNLTLKPDLRGKVAVVTGGAGRFDAEPRGSLLAQRPHYPPDYTRFHSNSGLITNIYYHALVDMGCEVDILPALGALVEEGQYPCDIPTLGEMVRDICHRNAVNYFGF